MKKQRILLTGDDGYNSIGIRLLIHFIKKDFQLAVAGTLKQQSGVGGFKSLHATGSWGKKNIDGIPVFWIDGSPVDAMELARIVFPRSFDAIISGINLGANVGGCLLTSGTFSAAAHGVNLGIAKRAIAISWDTPVAFHFRSHSMNDNISTFLEYPGKSAHKILKDVLSNSCWGADVININLPQNPTTVVEFTKPLKNIYRLWPTMRLDGETGIYSYNKGDRASHLGTKDTDVQALSHGHISVSPCQSTYLDRKTYEAKIFDRIAEAA